MRVETHGGQHCFQVEAPLGALNPGQICVELCANSNDGCKSSIESMTVPEPGADSHGMLPDSAQDPATRAASDFTEGILPHQARKFIIDVLTA